MLHLSKTIINLTCLCLIEVCFDSMYTGIFLSFVTKKSKKSDHLHKQI